MFFGHHGHEHGIFGRIRRHSRHEGSRERLLGHGDLKLVVLSLIAKAPAHGYELIKAIEEMSGGAYTPSPGAIYPTLSLLEDEGFCRTDLDGGKKLYTITETGGLFLEANRAALDRIAEKFKPREKGSYIGAARRIAAGRRALISSIKAKFRAGDMDAAKLDAVAKVLEDAAKAIDEL